MNTIRLTTVILASVVAMGMGSARADQPHMHRALELLRSAREELRVAEHDKGGWRSRAVRNVDAAIADAEKGIAFERGH
jgi:hypothetical protein